jgi:hypothetical protein
MKISRAEILEIIPGGLIGDSVPSSAKNAATQAGSLLFHAAVYRVANTLISSALCITILSSSGIQRP